MGVSCLWWLGSSLFSTFYRRIFLVFEARQHNETRDKQKRRNTSNKAAPHHRARRAPALFRLLGPPLPASGPSSPHRSRSVSAALGTAAPRLTDAKQSSVLASPATQAGLILPPQYDRCGHQGLTWSLVNLVRIWGCILGNMTTWSQSTAYLIWFNTQSPRAGYPDLHSHQNRTRIPIHPHPPQSLPSSSFVIFASLIVVLNCTPLLILGYISFSTNCLSLSFAPVAVWLLECLFLAGLLLVSGSWQTFLTVSSGPPSVNFV